MAQVVSLGYEPREEFIPYHLRRERWSCIVAHRRCGKTVACIADLVDAALRSPKQNARFAYVAPYYAQAKDVAWTYVKQFATPVPGVEVNESELRVDFPNGSRIRLHGCENYDRLRGIYLDGVVLDEPADFDPRAWPTVIRPALSDRKGWATFIGTPKGRNAFWDIWHNAQSDVGWFSLMLKASETGLVAPDELADARKMLTAEQYEQEFECSFDAAILGAYFGKEVAEAERAKRITKVEPASGIPVQTVWDLGMGDSTAIWFWQAAAGEIRVIDHYENSSQPLSHYAAEIRARGYDYGGKPTCWVPHDAKVRSLETGRTRIETLESLGLAPRLVPAHTLMDGINAARVTLPRCWFDEVKCRYGLEALRQYHSEFDEKTKAFKNTPKHDWTSHTADAFRYLALAWREIAAVETPKPKPTELIYSVGADGVVRSNMSVRDIVEMRLRKKRADVL